MSSRKQIIKEATSKYPKYGGAKNGRPMKAKTTRRVGKATPVTGERRYL